MPTLGGGWRKFWRKRRAGLVVIPNLCESLSYSVWVVCHREGRQFVQRPRHGEQPRIGVATSSSGPDEDVVSVGAESDKRGEDDSRQNAGNARHLVNATSIEKVQIARLQTDFDIGNVEVCGELMERPVLEVHVKLRTPEALVHDALRRSSIDGRVLQNQHSGELMFELMYRVIVAFLSQPNRVEMRLVGVAPVVGSNNRCTVLAPVRLMCSHH